MEKYLVNKKPKIKIDEDFFKVKEDEKVTYVIFFVVLVCFVLGYFSFLPTVQKLQEGRLAYANGVNEKNNLLEKKNYIDELGKKIEAKQGVIERSKFVLPEEPQIPEILVTLETIASENSLYINNFSPRVDEATNNGQEKNEKSYKKMEIQFDVTGNYIDFKQFLIALESNIRPIDIISINATSSGGLLDSEIDTLRFSIKGNIYHQ